MRITCVTYALTAGGAERVLADLARGLSKRGHNVTFITLSRENPDFYLLPESVHRIALEIGYLPGSIWPAIMGNFRRQVHLRRAIVESKPDAVISFLTITNVRTLMALVGTDIPVIASERSNPAARSYGKVWHFLRRLFYPKVACLVSPSAGVDSCFSWLPLERRRVIHNFVADDFAKHASLAPAPAGRHRIVTLGRLTFAKGQDLLLRAFSRLAPDYPDWDLWIAGEGEMRRDLESLIADLGLRGRVELLGEVTDPAGYLMACDIFVLTSRYEGFPSALLEAMVCGLPVISFNCRSGPSEIIRNRHDGLLVEPLNLEQMIDAMRRLMNDPSERKRLGSMAQNVRERFSRSAFLDEWERLAADVSNITSRRGE